MENGSKTVTIQDVARVAGVSKTAVSSALSGNGRLSAERREAILQVARQLRFEVNPHARRLSRGMSQNTIGFYALGLDVGVGTQKIQLIQHLLADRGYDVPLYAYGAYGAGEVVNQAKLMQTVCQQRPEAIVCCTGNFQAEVKAELELYIQRGGIVVCYDTPMDIDCDTVILDRATHNYEAAKYLLSMGHRELGLYVNGVNAPCGERLRGFMDALRDYGGVTDPEWMFNGLFESGGKAMAEHFLQLERRPSGIVVVNDNAALAFIAEVQNAGLQVPGDVSVVGQDDIAIAPYGRVPLTTISHPVEAIAHKVVELVCDRLQNQYDGPPRRIVMRGELIERASTAPPKSGP
jgi:DNA-binding LacI/PurR family transcriptional regulator